MLPSDVEKATQTLAYFASKEGGSIDKMKALKLAYFADRYHLRNYGRPVIGDVYFAMKRGPVASTVKDVAEQSDYLPADATAYVDQFLIPAKGTPQVGVKAAPNLGIFSETDREALKFAFETFGHLDAWQLSELTHEYPEWKRHEAALESHSRVEMQYVDFFEDPDRPVSVFERDPFEADREMLDILKEVFVEDRDAAAVLD